MLEILQYQQEWRGDPEGAMPRQITFEANLGKLQEMVDSAVNRALINLLTPFLGTCLGWQDRVAVRCGLLMRMVADEGEVECD